MSEEAGEVKRLRDACSHMNEKVCQTLGKALGYPWFRDDQETFPNSGDEHGVCVGDHVAESIAEEAARSIIQMRAALKSIAGMRPDGGLPVEVSRADLWDCIEAMRALAREGCRDA